MASGWRELADERVDREREDRYERDPAQDERDRRASEDYRNELTLRTGVAPK